MIKLNQTQASAESGISRETFKRQAEAAGLETGPGVTYTIKEILTIMDGGDLKSERVRRERAEANKIERLNRVAEGRLLDVVEVEKFIWNDFLLPLKQEIEQMPKTYGPLCNPQEPAVAEMVLNQWVEKVKLNLKNRERD